MTNKREKISLSLSNRYNIAESYIILRITYYSLYYYTIGWAGFACYFDPRSLLMYGKRWPRFYFSIGDEISFDNQNKTRYMRIKNYNLVVYRYSSSFIDNVNGWFPFIEKYFYRKSVAVAGRARGHYRALREYNGPHVTE